jgi:hypothetical protein
MLGDYADTMDIDALMEKKNGGGASPELAKLKGKRFVVASESDEGQRLKPGLIKRLTGDRYTQVVEHPGVTREGQDHKVRDGEAAKQNG